MNLQKRIQHFLALGEKMLQISEQNNSGEYADYFSKAQQNNPWFTHEAMQFAFLEIGTSLSEGSLKKWLENYNIEDGAKQKTVGLVLAGNIPLVGFHDILCSLIAGFKVKAKLSSKDSHLYELLLKLLLDIDEEFGQLIEFSERQIKDVDAIIATGSNNSARYFEYYFKKYPNIIRKNRNSVALLTGEETDDDFHNLGKDIFTYFGLGCRNVSFLLVPEGFDFVKMLKAFEKYADIVNHTKYSNNYDYQRAIYLMNNIPIYDNGSVILKEDGALSSPIGVLHYKIYANNQEATEFLNQHKESIQCVVSKTKHKFPTYSYGEAQKPNLWDYADDIDTLKFLLDIK